MSEDLKDFLKGKPVQIKNAVMMLNEMFPPPKAPQYKVTSQTGPPNNPTFSMVCCIQDENFSGEGMGIFLLFITRCFISSFYTLNGNFSILEMIF